MKTLTDETLADNTGGAFEVMAGQVLRLEGRTTAEPAAAAPTPHRSARNYRAPLGCQGNK